MGQKVNPIGLRLGVNKTWQSKWYANFREYADLMLEDIKIRKLISNIPECKNADIAEIEIVRHPQRVTIFIHTAKAGMIIGQKGATIDAIGKFIQSQLKQKVQIKIKEIKRADVNASLIAQNVGRQLMGRASYKKAIKQSINNAMRGGVQGIKIRLAGRLGGSEMKRVEEHKDGRVPLHTLRADIDYATFEAHTTYGKIGVKVWVYNGMNYGIDRGTTEEDTKRPRRDNRRPETKSDDGAPDTTQRPARAEKGDHAPKTKKAEPAEKETKDTTVKAKKTEAKAKKTDTKSEEKAPRATKAKKAAADKKDADTAEKE